MSIINTIADAVIASGKTLSQVGRQPIFDYLKKAGLSKSSWEDIYKDLEKMLEPLEPVSNDAKVVNPLTSAGTSGYGGQQSSKNIVDYSDSTHNNVKERTPRKTVFSEITKIAG